MTQTPGTGGLGPEPKAATNIPDLATASSLENLKTKAVRGGMAKLCAQGANFTLRIGSLMVMARLLEPRDFGLVGMVTAFTGILNLFRDFGLSTAAVQRPTVTEEQKSTLFWINLLVGGILAVTLLGASPLIAAFYREPRLVWVSAALASGFIFNAAGVQHAALLQRQMRFTTMAAIDVFSLVVSIIIGLTLAARNFGYWALVAMAVVPLLVNTICFWIASAWVPGRPHRQVGIRSMMRFGGTITLNGIVVYVAYNMEKVLLGRFWGAQAMGLYGRAYQLINIPTDNLNTAVGEVAFSALSRVQHEPSRLKTYFLKGYSLVLALTIPITIVCAVFAHDLILVVLGPKWNEAIAIFRLLAPTILIFALINPLSWLLFSLGMVGRSLKIALVLAPLVIAGYVIGLPHGPKGVALAYSTVMALWVVPHIAWCVRGTVVSFRDILAIVSRPLASGAIAVVPGYATSVLLGSSMPAVVRLMLGISVLLAVYIGVLFYVLGQRSFYLDLFANLIGRSRAGTKKYAAA